MIVHIQLASQSKLLNLLWWGECPWWVQIKKQFWLCIFCFIKAFAICFVFSQQVKTDTSFGVDQFLTKCVFGNVIVIKAPFHFHQSMFSERLAHHCRFLHGLPAQFIANFLLAIVSVLFLFWYYLKCNSLTKVPLILPAQNTDNYRYQPTPWGYVLINLE